MVYPNKRYVPLDSMGFELDNVGIDVMEQFMFMPSDGSIVFDPSSEKIKTYVGNHPNAVVSSSRDVSEHELYYNRISKRAYTWNGTDMVEADLSVCLQEPEPTADPVPPAPDPPPQGDTDFSNDDTVYHITSVITDLEMSDRVIGDNVTLVFHEGGCLVGITLKGRYSLINDSSNPDYGKLCSIKVIPGGEELIFDGCSFTGCRFVDSELFATNFGAISGMTSIDSTYSQPKSQGLAYRMRKRPNSPPSLSGPEDTTNIAEFNQIEHFLSGSDGIKLKFNGSFYTAQPKILVVNSARNLVLYGDPALDGATPPCKLIHGICMKDCLNVHIHDLSFVGFHEVHEFPVCVTKRTQLFNHLTDYKRLPETFNTYGLKVGADEQQRSAYLLIKDWVDTYGIFTGDLDAAMSPINPEESGVYKALKDAFKENTYDIDEDNIPLMNFGIAETAIRAERTINGLLCGLIEIDRCHFEMRQDGTVGYNYFNDSDTGENICHHLSGFHVHDCTFDHIYYQAVSSYCADALFERISATYCMQGVDISTSASNTVVRDSDFTHCATGPKQACEEGYEVHVHHNLIENCCFTIDDQYCIMNTSHFMCLAEQGRVRDTFVVRDCTFNMCSRFRSSGLICRAWNTRFERVVFNMGSLYTDLSQAAVAYMVGMGSALREGTMYNDVSVEFIGCEMNVNCRVYNLVEPHASGIKPSVFFRECQVVGSGSISANYFSFCSRVDVSDCGFMLPNSHLVDRCDNVILLDSNFSHSTGAAFCFPDSNKTPIDMYLHVERCNLSTDFRLVDIKTSGGRFSFSCCSIVALSLMRRTRPTENAQGMTPTVVPIQWFAMAGCSITIAGARVVDGICWPQDSEPNTVVNEWEMFELSNNVFKSTSQCVISGSSVSEIEAATPQEVAHVFYNNFLCRKIPPVNEGELVSVPSGYPWAGMVYYDTTTGHYNYFDGSSWIDDLYNDKD